MRALVLGLMGDWFVPVCEHLVSHWFTHGLRPFSIPSCTNPSLHYHERSCLTLPFERVSSQYPSDRIVNDQDLSDGCKCTFCFLCLRSCQSHHLCSHVIWYHACVIWWHTAFTHCHSSRDEVTWVKEAICIWLCKVSIFNYNTRFRIRWTKCLDGPL